MSFKGGQASPISQQHVRRYLCVFADGTGRPQHPGCSAALQRNCYWGESFSWNCCTHSMFWCPGRVWHSSSVATAKQQQPCAF